MEEFADSKNYLKLNEERIKEKPERNFEFNNGNIVFYDEIIPDEIKEFLSLNSSKENEEYKPKYLQEKGENAELKEKLKEEKNNGKELKRERKDLRSAVTRLENTVKGIESQQADVSKINANLAWSQVQNLAKAKGTGKYALMIPPSDIEIEQKVIGMLLNNPNIKLGFSQKYLNKMFFRAAHTDIHVSMINLGEKADVTTVTSELKRRNLLNRCGGADYLSSLESAGADIKMPEVKIDNYVRILEEHFLGRALIGKCGQTMNTVLSEQLPKTKGGIPSMTEQIRLVSGEILNLLPYRFKYRFDKGLETKILKENFKETIKRKGKPKITTGYEVIDEFLHGILPNRLIIIGARPKIGKTTLATNIMENVCSQEHNALIYSFEMNRQEIMQMMASKLAKIDREKFEICKSISDKEKKRFDKATEYLEKLPFYIYDGRADIDFIIESSKREKTWHPDLKLVVVDTLQSFKTFPYMTKTDTYSEVVRRLKEEVAKELDVTVFLTGQLKQDVEKYPGKKPKNISDFVDCKGIGESLDQAILLHRPEFYLDKEEYTGWMQLIFTSRFGKSNKSRRVGCEMQYANIFPWIDK